MTQTKTVNGEALPASAFLVVPDPEKPSTWALPVRDASGKPSHVHMGAAWAALHGGYRDNVYEGPDKADAIATLTALYKAESMPVPDGKRQADDPGVGDVHVDAPLTNGAGGGKRSPMLKRLMQGLRKRVSTKRYITAEDLEAEYRSALGHAGGSTRHAAEPSDWEVCAACQAGHHEDCTCPACIEGDPDDCLCDAVLAQDDDEIDPSAAHEMGAPHVHSETGEAFRLFLPSAFAEAPRWIPYLPKPGVFTHPTYGKIEITPERNRAFVDNFASGVYQSQLPLDAEHQTKLSGAVGWIRALRQNLDGSVDAQVDWTDRGRSLLASDRFKYVSPEWYDQWTAPESGQTHENVAIGGALTTRPFFKESALRPLVATEAGFSTPNDSTPFTTPAGDKETEKMPEPVQLTEEEIKRFREMETEVAQARQAAEQAEADRKLMAERVAAIEAEGRRRSFAEQAKTWHGDVGTHVSFMEALPSDELRAQYVTQQTAQAIALAEAQKQASLFRPVGVSGVETAGSALGKIAAAAETIRASEPKLTPEQARARALKTNPALYAEYLAETEA